MNKINTEKYPTFSRQFLESSDVFSIIGSGKIGGKASGLVFIRDILKEKISTGNFGSIDFDIPKLTVIGTDVFDKFLERNNLYEIAFSNESDIEKIIAFRDASLPTEILGDLRSIVNEVKTPLAVRSSSLLEDAKEEPFAGIYSTKMIPNNQTSPDERFRTLDNAIKFVYASTFFKAARDYLNATKYNLADEKMAVIIQEVVGKRANSRYYPHISGVARSFNYYPMGKSKPEDGVVNLALGLGKQIVDGGLSWTYSPAYPKAVPPFAGTTDILKNTQTEFWSVNMGSAPKYSPTSEAHFLTYDNITEAEKDLTLKHVASTFSVESNRIIIGIGTNGPRVLNFAPLLVLNEFKFNEFIKRILQICEEAYSNPVEIEFAANFDSANEKMKFGFLQVRPMTVSDEEVQLGDDELFSENVLVSSNKVLGNGTRSDLNNIVFVKPDIFETVHTKKIALEIEEINKKLHAINEPYLLIGFGRWGSSDPWLGIPVEWGQISGAKCIVESTLPGVNVDLSQGSHFFHNITSFQVSYFSIHHNSEFKIDWNWLNSLEVINELLYTKLVKSNSCLNIKIDGRTGRGVIFK